MFLGKEREERKQYHIWSKFLLTSVVLQMNAY